MKYLSEEQNKCFVGTGELNKAGDSLAVFLDKYDPDKYQNPCNTVDTLVFTKEDSQVKRILLIKRENHPCIGLWACPGGFVEFKENLYDAALRELQEELVCMILKQNSLNHMAIMTVTQEQGLLQQHLLH